MEAMRQSWTDERLDDFRGEVNRRFDEVNRRFDEVDQRFEQVDHCFDRVDGELLAIRSEMHIGFEKLSEQMNLRFESLQRSMFQASVVLIVAVLGLLGTQL